MKEILLVEDDDLFADALQGYLSCRYKITLAETAERALEIMEEGFLPDLAIFDLFLPGMDGIELLQETKKFLPNLPILMLTASKEISQVVECVKLGAFDYLTKSSQEIPGKLFLAIARALEAVKIREELEQHRKLQVLSQEKYRLIGTSSTLEKIKKDMAILGKTDSTVLIQGETGTGKELVARGIHSVSLRAQNPFVAINCGAIAKELIESELFGHSKGAFTGAQRDEPGKFRLANGGTLFLDEIGELSEDSQVKLLRVLQEREFYPVGASKLVKVDVRILASTNRDLSAMVEEGTFREDLFFRLNICAIPISPLRERPKDILDLAHYFMKKYNQKFSKNFQTIAPEAEEHLLSHQWKGNVRELSNTMERVLLFEEGPSLQRNHLSFLRSSSKTLTIPFQFSEDGLEKILEDGERFLLQKALEMAKGNKAKASKLLKITRASFVYRLGKYGGE